MKRQIIKQLIFGCLVAAITTSCTSLTNLFPKEPRPFQKKKFDSQMWKNGDYQIRGEMAEDLRRLISNPKEEWKKSADEVRQILGKPDLISEADCCEVGRGHVPQKVELWLYYLEIEEDYYRPREKGEAERKLVPQAFKLYFRKNSSRSFETMIDERTGDHSFLMPVVGYLNGHGKFFDRLMITR